MSDGNFNTQLLSHGGFASGVRAGEARMKQRATAAFFDVLINDCGFCEDENEFREQRPPWGDGLRRKTVQN